MLGRIPTSWIVIQLKREGIKMRYLTIWVMGFAGLTAGILFDLFLNGFPATETTLFWGISGAVFLIVFHFLVKPPARVEKASLRSKPPILRHEPSGTFKERLSQFATNIDDLPNDSNVEPIEFWALNDSGDYESTPPKPPGIIRFLLHRIRRILTGK